MKKILVLSDSHRDIEHMQAAVSLEKPDLIIHLGDHISDANKLTWQFPHIPMIAVPGNCDFSSEQTVRIINIEGYHLMICHGHQYHVKSSLLSIEYAAKEKNADAVLFGHTHHICCDYHNGLLIFNPGSIGQPPYKGSNSYGILEIDENGIHANTKTISI